MALTRCVALEVAEHGVRINAVSPSLRDPSIPRARPLPRSCSTSSKSREAYGRGAEPWEVANVMVFLASDYASYMTGEIVSVSSQHP